MVDTEDRDPDARRLLSRSQGTDQGQGWVESGCPESGARRQGPGMASYHQDPSFLSTWQRKNSKLCVQRLSFWSEIRFLNVDKKVDNVSHPSCVGICATIHPCLGLSVHITFHHPWSLKTVFFCQPWMMQLASLFLESIPTKSQMYVHHRSTSASASTHICWKI